ncbi:MAG TPA: (Fe-S)-binding protein [Acidobacteriota bacterium]|jgi:L-lactate dehydrogenase complex protein LldE
MKVGLFVTCIVDQFFPDVAWATVKVLRKAGVEVCFDSRQTCCGQPAYNSGFWSEARRVSGNLFPLFPDVDHIVVPSGSCAAMMRNHLSEVHTDSDPGEIQKFSRRVVELSEFLVRVCGIEDLSASFRARAAFHDSCHALRDLRVGDAPRKLLRKVRDLELVELPGADQCCGFGGLFSVKYPEISASMGSDKLGCLQQSGANVLVSADMSCLMHLKGMMQKQKFNLRTMHLAEVLASG